jgi:tRNA (guanine-N7-)-methyltransferase
MRLRNVKNAREIVDNSSFVVHEPKEFKGKYNEVFGNDNPIELEIGMGKGNFIIDKAIKNPDINFIGVERYESVLCRALEKLEDKQLPNVKIICIDAIELDEVFDKEISTIYLNFSDPWPKKRHAKRRLTAPQYLRQYYRVIKKGGKVYIKTDNDSLYTFTLEMLEESPFKIICNLEDYQEIEQFDTPTEYEESFRSMGEKIHRVVLEKL